MTLSSCLRDLDRAVEEGRRLGLDVSAGAAVLERAAERLGFPGSAYVLALAGGTGVGKSSVLNALAGRVISPARAIRPTTSEPVAGAASERRDELASMLDWLGSSHVVGHA